MRDGGTEGQRDEGQTGHVCWFQLDSEAGQQQEVLGPQDDEFSSNRRPLSLHLCPFTL